jgi:hypothetical protein
MAIFQKTCWCAFALFAAVLTVKPGAFVKSPLPLLGRDTVLVWNIHNQSYGEDFVVRIAEFSPDRFLEWEDTRTQGTIFMPYRDIDAAKGYASTNLFAPGVDKRSKNTTTLWLSRQIYQDLKDKKKAKCNLDGVAGSLTYRGDGYFTVKVNRSSMELLVIKVSDDRGSERWFLDQEENPLMVRHMIREFTQTLTSITTDQPNTLRWIKGSKLTNLPH